MEWTDRIGRRIKLRDLHIALVVTQTGSMLKAAEHLAISQPVVSKVIADLEHALGVRLFDRSRRGVEPTPAGRALFNRGRAAFDELRQGVKEVEFLTDPTAGELRIAATENMVAGLIPAVVDRLSRQYPRIVFHVTQALSAAGQFRELRDRDVELLICRLPKSFPEEDLEVEILLDEPFLVAAAVHNRWSKRRRIQLSELADEPWILPRPESFVGALVAKIFEDGGFKIPSASVVCNSFQMSNALLATGRFIGIYPGSLVRLGAKRLAIKGTADPFNARRHRDLKEPSGQPVGTAVHRLCARDSQVTDTSGGRFLAQTSTNGRKRLMYTKLKHEPSREVGKARRRLLILRRIDRRAWYR